MRLHRSYIVLIYIFLLAWPSISLANCSFKTIDFIDELDVPKSITSIQIKIPKSAKYNQDFFKLMLTNTQFITPKFKKKFKAIITVKYKFGTCTYKATVRQSGDFKDHIKLVNGNPFRSLLVELKDGNVQKAVKFKLLLPETRMHYNEILGTIITRELGFIAPETFEVLVNVNGTESIMLFQEDARKEMLERNERREGPMFEGDESMSLAYEDTEWTTFFDVALSRLTNRKWFSLGKSSEIITLQAYNQLQESHLRNIIFFPNLIERYVISPNKNRTTEFQDYYFLMAAMNGSHALYPNNRKYYYNSFLGSFEPIYYDGNLNLKGKLISSNLLLEYAFAEGYYFSKKDELQSKVFYTAIIDQFENRIIDYSNSSKKFAIDSMKQISLNTELLQKEISITPKKKLPEFKLPQAITQYFDRLKKHKLDHKNIHLIARNNEFYVVKDNYQNTFKITKEQLGTVMSKNIFNGKPHILLPQNLPSDIKKEDIKKELLKINGSGILISNSGINIKIDNLYKKIVIKQSDPNDWVLFRDVDLSGWEIKFNGVERNLGEKKTQRFNSYGMTGCLNFYNSLFKDTLLFADGGQCEDTINIANSNGYISKLNVSNSFADAVDFDFSKLNISDASITNAGNDCLDVSGGSYDVLKASLVNCSDKGISVGEVSTFKGEKISVSQANIGISSKDFSKVKVSEYLTDNVVVCIEARKKKQEFGGSLAIIKQMSCEGPRNEDIHSSIIEGGL